jgi:hypothetical protein
LFGLLAPASGLLHGRSMNGIKRGVHGLSQDFCIEGEVAALRECTASSIEGSHQVVLFRKPPPAQKPQPEGEAANASVITSAMETFSLGFVNTLVGSGKSLAASVDAFSAGVTRIASGDFARGFADIGKSLLGLFVQQPIDGLIMLAGSTFAAIHMLLGFEKPGRALKDEEIAEARKVFGDSIDYSRVRIKEGTRGVLSSIVRPFVFGDTIYAQGADGRLSPSALIHELAHVWQHQRTGPSYLSGAIGAQMFGDGYDWEKGLKNGLTFAELNPEQQAEFIADAYAAGYFAAPENGFVWQGRDYSAQIAQARRLMLQKKAAQQ